MNRATRNRIVRWMNDHHIHYPTAMALTEGCAAALARASACHPCCSADDLITLARDYYTSDRRGGASSFPRHGLWRDTTPPTRASHQRIVDDQPPQGCASSCLPREE